MLRSLRSRRMLGLCAPAALTLLLAACSAAVVDDPSESTSQAASTAGATSATSTAAAAGDVLGIFPAARSFCTLFDSDFLGVDAGPACARSTGPTCPDRVDTWDNTIVLDFAIALTSDCRFGHLADGSLLSSADISAYLNDLLSFTLDFFGCPVPGTQTGPLTFGLIPAPLQSDVFTTADLNAFSATYAAAIAQALSDNGSPALTPLQSLAVDAKLLLLEHTVKKVVLSTKFTFSTCTTP